MICPSCGCVLSTASQDRCPQCGWRLSETYTITPSVPSPSAHAASSDRAWPAERFAAPARGRRHRQLVAALAALVVLVALASLGVTLHAMRAPKGSAPLTEAPLGVTTPTSTPRSQSTPTVIFSDPMTRNIHGWAQTADCFFGAGGYHMSDRICYAPTDAIGDATVSARIHQIKGTTRENYGFVLRRISVGNEYGFNVSGSGTWIFYRCISGTCQNIASAGAAAIHPGATATNTLQVAMRGSHFELSVNGVDVGGVDDTTYRGGYLGLEAGAGGEAVFSQVRITTGG